jgi:hypothetical protein
MKRWWGRWWERPRIRTGWGFPLSSGTRLIPLSVLRSMVDLAPQRRLVWIQGGLVVDEEGLFLVVPYVWQTEPIPSWKCYVIAFEGGLSLGAGQAKHIKVGRLDVRPADYEALPLAPRKVERQLLQWLGWRVGVELHGRGGKRANESG